MSRTPPPHDDQKQYWHFTAPQRLCKALSSIDGFLKGISADQRIVPEETDGFRALLEHHKDVLDDQTLKESLKVLVDVCGGRITGDDLFALAWLSEAFNRGSKYFDAVTNDVQRLHAIMGGMAADSILNENELRELTVWVRSKPHLHGCWPFRQFVPLLIRVLEDGRIDTAEHDELLKFFRSFSHSALPRSEKERWPSQTMQGIGPHCKEDPEIGFIGSTFCLTGASSVCPRKRIAEIIEQLGGTAHPRITLDVDFLVYCKRGNAAWAYLCYGRKVEAAIELREDHEYPIQIVREIDFWDAVVKHGGKVPFRN